MFKRNFHLLMIYLIKNQFFHSICFLLRAFILQYMYFVFCTMYIRYLNTTINLSIKNDAPSYAYMKTQLIGTDYIKLCITETML